MWMNARLTVDHMDTIAIAIPNVSIHLDPTTVNAYQAMKKSTSTHAEVRFSIQCCTETREWDIEISTYWFKINILKFCSVLGKLYREMYHINLLTLSNILDSFLFLVLFYKNFHVSNVIGWHSSRLPLVYALWIWILLYHMHWVTSKFIVQLYGSQEDYSVYILYFIQEILQSPGHDSEKLYR